MPEALVIGAGPAGLTAAYELYKLGVTSAVLESDRQVGGLSRTVNYRGYRFDIGGHRFFTKVPAVKQLWNEILGEDFLVRPRLSRIYYGGKFFDYPLRAANAVWGLGPVEALLVTLSYAKAQLFPNAEESNFEQWVSNRFGRRLYEVFFKTYTEKVWGISCSEISADWAAQRIKNLSLREAVRNSLFGNGRAKDGEVITSLIESFHYPRFGPGMMWERCESLLAENGCETTRGIKVEQLRHHNGRVTCVIGRTTTGERVEVAAEHFISTMPLRELIFALNPLPPNEVVRAASELRYRDYLTVVLIAKRESVFDDNWIYIHSPEVRMGRVQNYKNWSPAMVPDPSRTSLGLEYFLWEKDREWRWSNDRLIELGMRECRQIGLVEQSEVEDGTVVRMKKAYPVYDQSYQDNLSIIRRYLETLPNLQTIGRNGLHRYNNQDHSMLTAIYAARNIAGEKNDVWSVNTEMDYHEEQTSSSTSGDRLVPSRVIPVRAITEHATDAIIETAFAKVDPMALGAALGTVFGVAVFLATAILLLKGGEVVGPNLSLIGHYLLGFKVSWAGAFVGLIEAAIGFFLLGYAGASLRNLGMSAYAYVVRRRADAEARRDLLDRL